MKKTLFTIISLLATSVMYAEPQSYIVYDFLNNNIIEAKNLKRIQPIASLTKLMTANVFLKLNEDPLCMIDINSSDNDTIKKTKTRLPKNVPLLCQNLLEAMLVGSDNYAASALGRSIPKYSKDKFIKEMNKQAKEWGMNNTKFYDTSGLSKDNTSNIEDLIILAHHSMLNDDIREITRKSSTNVKSFIKKVGTTSYNNSNVLVRNRTFDGFLSKTGYIKESGYNLIFVNQAKCRDRTIGVISLNNNSSLERANFTKTKIDKYDC